MAVVTKHDLKEAVSESLLEALQIAEEKQRKDSFSIKAVLVGVVQILQVLLLPILAYLLLQSVNVQKEIAVLQIQMTGISSNLEKHNETSSDAVRKNAVLHHNNRQLNCGNCHGSGE